MTNPGDTPAPGSRSETASAIRDGAIGAAARAAAAISLTTDTFAYLASMAGIYEIEAARIARVRAKRADVKGFAEKMIDDHTKMANQLKSFLGGMNRPNSPPDEPDALHRVLLNDLHGAADEDFDERYIAQQGAAHATAITLFRQYGEHGDDEGLRNLAKLALPVLNEHRALVRKLEARPN